jgi:hypothetical protein
MLFIIFQARLACFTAPGPPCTPKLSHRGPPLRPLSTPLTPPNLRTNAVCPLDHLADALGCSSKPPLPLPIAWITPPWNPLLRWAPRHPPPHIRFTIDRTCSPDTPPSTTSRLPTGFCWQAADINGEKSSPIFWSWAKRPYAPGYFARPGRAPLWTQAHCNSAILYFSSRIIEIQF